MGFFNLFNINNKPNSNSDYSSLEPEDMELKNEVVELVQREIKFGFDNKEDILESIWCAGFENEDMLDEEWLKKIIAHDYESNLINSKKWIKPSDFDKLTKAFDELNKENIIALHKAGYTKQDGYDDVREVADLIETNIKPLGYCFYHTQDLERAIEPTIKNLYLAFDDMDQDDDKAVHIGNVIVEKLNKHGLETEWNGTINQRIKINNINWQKVPDNQEWGMGRALHFLNAASL